jgi:hypothetical protein
MTLSPGLGRLAVLRGDEAAHTQFAEEGVASLLLLLLLLMLMLLLLLKPHTAALSVIPRGVVVGLHQQQNHRGAHDVSTDAEHIVAAAG